MGRIKDVAGWQCSGWLCRMQDHNQDISRIHCSVRFTLLVFATDCIFIPFIHKIHEICTLTHAYFIIIKAHGKVPASGVVQRGCRGSSRGGSEWSWQKPKTKCKDKRSRETRWQVALQKEKENQKNKRQVASLTGGSFSGSNQHFVLRPPHTSYTTPPVTVNLFTRAQVGYLLTVLSLAGALYTPDIWQIGSPPSASAEDVPRMWRVTRLA